MVAFRIYLINTCVLVVSESESVWCVNMQRWGCGGGRWGAVEGGGGRWAAVGQQPRIVTVVTSPCRGSGSTSPMLHKSAHFPRGYTAPWPWACAIIADVDEWRSMC